MRVIADKKVEVAVVIKVDPRGARAPLLLCGSDAGAVSRVDKFPGALVMKEPVATECGEKQVGQAVIVVIADRHPHTKKLHFQTAPPSYIFNAPASVVA